MRQIEKGNVFERGDPLNTGKNKENENRVALTFFLIKHLQIFSKNEETLVCIEHKYVSKQII